MLLNYSPYNDESKVNQISDTLNHIRKIISKFQDIIDDDVKYDYLKTDKFLDTNLIKQRNIAIKNLMDINNKIYTHYLNLFLDCDSEFITRDNKPLNFSTGTMTEERTGSGSDSDSDSDSGTEEESNEFDSDTIVSSLKTVTLSDKNNITLCVPCIKSCSNLKHLTIKKFPYIDCISNNMECKNYESNMFNFSAKLNRCIDEDKIIKNLYGNISYHNNVLYYTKKNTKCEISADETFNILHYIKYNLEYKSADLYLMNQDMNIYFYYRDDIDFLKEIINNINKLQVSHNTTIYDPSDRVYINYFNKVIISSRLTTDTKTDVFSVNNIKSIQLCNIASKSHFFPPYLLDKYLELVVKYRKKHVDSIDLSPIYNDTTIIKEIFYGPNISDIKNVFGLIDEYFQYKRFQIVPNKVNTKSPIYYTSGMGDMSKVFYNSISYEDYVRILNTLEQTEFIKDYISFVNLLYKKAC